MNNLPLCFHSHKHFRFIRLLGVGARGRAFLVERFEDGNIYALKLSSLQRSKQTAGQEAVNEVRLLASVRHPHIVQYYEAFVEGEYLCLVMDALSGGDLASYIRSQRADQSLIPEDSIWSCALQIGEAIQHLHSNNIMHRDVKPQNVLLSNDGLMKLADLGISKLMQHKMTDSMVGTPTHMPPEVWEGRPYSKKCDIWGFGCLLYEMAALKPPFQGSSMSQIRFQVLRGNAKRIPPVYSEALWMLVHSMLRYDPNARPSMEQLLHHSSMVSRRHLLPRSRTPSIREDLLSQVPPIMPPIQIPDNLELLTLKLPPATYRTGQSVQDSLRQQLMERSVPKSSPTQGSHQSKANSTMDATAASGSIRRCVCTSSFTARSVVMESRGVASSQNLSQSTAQPCSSPPESSQMASVPQAAFVQIPSSTILAVDFAAISMGQSVIRPTTAPVPQKRSRRSQIYCPMAEAIKKSPIMLAAVGSVFHPPSRSTYRNQSVEVSGKPGEPPLILHPKFAGILLRESCEALIKRINNPCMSSTSSKLYPSPADSQQEENVYQRLGPATPQPQPILGSASPIMDSPLLTAGPDSQGRLASGCQSSFLGKEGSCSCHISLGNPGNASSKLGGDHLTGADAGIGPSVVATVTVGEAYQMASGSGREAYHTSKAAVPLAVAACTSAGVAQSHAGVHQGHSLKKAAIPGSQLKLFLMKLSKRFRSCLRPQVDKTLGVHC